MTSYNMVAVGITIAIAVGISYNYGYRSYFIVSIYRLSYTNDSCQPLLLTIALYRGLRKLEAGHLLGDQWHYELEVICFHNIATVVQSLIMYCSAQLQCFPGFLDIQIIKRHYCSFSGSCCLFLSLRQLILLYDQ